MAEQKAEEGLTEAQEKLYDRHQFIGRIAQERLVRSNVLIINLTGPNTELAKNIILAGANITICDNNLVSQDDVDTNFLFGPQDLGQNRGLIGQKEFKEINPLAKIEHIAELPSEDQLNKFTIIVTSTKDFEIMEKFDEISQRLNIPYYNLLCCGFYGFVYITLGSNFTYEREKRVIRQITFGQKLQDTPQYREFEEVTAQCVPLKNILNFKYKVKGFQQNNIYYSILMMYKARQDPELAKYDPFDHNEELLNRIVQIGIQVYKDALEQEPTQDVIDQFKSFAKLYGIDYCPVYSILGSVASQEMIYAIGRNNEPAINWFCFDGEQTYGLVEVIQDISTFKTKDLPHKKQLIEK